MLDWRSVKFNEVIGKHDSGTKRVNKILYTVKSSPADKPHVQEKKRFVKRGVRIREKGPYFTLPYLPLSRGLDTKTTKSGVYECESSVDPENCYLLY